MQSKGHLFHIQLHLRFHQFLQSASFRVELILGSKVSQKYKKGLVNSRIQWFYCIKTPWAFLNFIFHSEHASTDGAQAKLRSCLDLWWEKHSFEYCLKLRRWVHISVETITEFYMNLNFLERIWTCPKSQLWQYEDHLWKTSTPASGYVR